MGTKQPQGNTRSFTINMLISKETPGALQFKEIDGDGGVVPQHEAKIGTLYVRKSAFNGGASPKALKVTVQG